MMTTEATAVAAPVKDRRFHGGRLWFIPSVGVVRSENPVSRDTPRRPKFASISFPNIFGKPNDEQEQEGVSEETFFEDSESETDYRYTPEVEEILKRKASDELRDGDSNLSAEDENKPLVKFARRAKEIREAENKREVENNERPFRREDWEVWKRKPHVIGHDGLPLPRRSFKTGKEASDRFWDFAMQFFFGLWGFRRRPYPPFKPFDVGQAIGYKNLERRYYDFIMKSGGFFYKDRLGRTRGPCELVHLRTAWGAGIIDKNTFVWGEDMDEWAPISHIYGMERAVATMDAKLARFVAAFAYKVLRGVPLWAPLKGHDNRTPKELQAEAMEEKRRDMALLEASGGCSPLLAMPGRALFPWSSGSQLTHQMEDEGHLPTKYIPKWLREQLMAIVPGLRPWEVLSIEQAMNQLTYRGKWFREPLGTHTVGPDYIDDSNDELQELMSTFNLISRKFYEKAVKAVPGFDEVVRRMKEIAETRRRGIEEKRLAKKREDTERRLFGKPLDQFQDGEL